jgi:hypothetical protein
MEKLVAKYTEDELKKMDDKKLGEIRDVLQRYGSSNQEVGIPLSKIKAKLIKEILELQDKRDGE